MCKSVDCERWLGYLEKHTGIHRENVQTPHREVWVGINPLTRRQQCWSLHRCIALANTHVLSERFVIVIIRSMVLVKPFGIRENTEGHVWRSRTSSQGGLTKHNMGRGSVTDGLQRWVTSKVSHRRDKQNSSDLTRSAKAKLGLCLRAMETMR